MTKRVGVNALHLGGGAEFDEAALRSTCSTTEEAQSLTKRVEVNALHLGGGAEFDEAR